MNGLQSNMVSAIFLSFYLKLIAMIRKMYTSYIAWCVVEKAHLSAKHHLFYKLYLFSNLNIDQTTWYKSVFVDPPPPTNNKLFNLWLNMQPLQSPAWGQGLRVL